MISASVCLSSQPDTAVQPAKEFCSYTTCWDTISPQDASDEIQWRMDCHKGAWDRAAGGVELVLARRNEERQQPDQDQHEREDRDRRRESCFPSRRSGVRGTVRLRCQCPGLTHRSVPYQSGAPAGHWRRSCSNSLLPTLTVKSTHQTFVVKPKPFVQYHP